MNSEQNIIRMIQNGDIKAFKIFFESFYPTLCLFSKRYIIQEDAANDIVQEAFIYFWNKKDEIQSENHARSYLYKYVKNRSLNYIRDKKTIGFLNIENLELDRSTHESIVIEETNEIIYKAINKLSPQGQEIIELSLDGLKNQEIADKLKISINSVKTVKLRAFKVLRKELKDFFMGIFMLFSFAVIFCFSLNTQID
jgi:RNA polymerase sigma-70 factor (family 1)